MEPRCNSVDATDLIITKQDSTLMLEPIDYADFLLGDAVATVGLAGNYDIRSNADADDMHFVCHGLSARAEKASVSSNLLSPWNSVDDNTWSRFDTEDDKTVLLLSPTPTPLFVAPLPPQSPPRTSPQASAREPLLIPMSSLCPASPSSPPPPPSLLLLSPKKRSRSAKGVTQSTMKNAVTSPQKHKHEHAIASRPKKKTTTTTTPKKKTSRKIGYDLEKKANDARDKKDDQLRRSTSSKENPAKAKATKPDKRDSSHLLTHAQRRRNVSETAHTLKSANLYLGGIEVSRNAAASKHIQVVPLVGNSFLLDQNLQENM